ncbi:hypothetical protein HCN44_001250 [Aphidius gifuensis]|uniref:ABC transporter domain-containing protein n=1 Tax=Aphidius gifuensis TaxID=684658 RepID=A0A834XKS2_APHGI|nr:ATP-binding cassette sub-family G member 4-like [Aphidius gifuensis]KAF7988677.1 hypothetical protein HCN44_001250 [Aphidius gifuensis]
MDIETTSSIGKLFNFSFEEVTQSGRVLLEKKKLLHNVNGDFRVGELTAIAGASGSGKTVLMDILSGFVKSESGIISLDNKLCDRKVFRRFSSYVMQNDNLDIELTVNESMNFAADLKLQLSAEEKNQRIIEILDAMKLKECRNTRIIHISGGQKKRLSIALELINNPSIMFFDEPTTGLDIVAAKQCIRLLKALAKEGPRIVVITIHQPSATIFDMIDHLYFINNGQCVYTGGTKLLVPFLDSIGIQCPYYHNPADFLLELCSGIYGDYNEKLIDAIENGKCNNWRSKSENSDDLIFNGLSLELPQLYSSNDMNKNQKKQYATSFLKQFSILFHKRLLTLLRNRASTLSRLFVHLVVALLVGTLYWNIGNSAHNAKNNFNFLFYNIMFLMYTAFNTMIITYPLSMPVIKREYFNRWYKLRSIYLANKIADLPIQIVSVTLYVLIVYLMTRQILELNRFAMLYLAHIAVSLVAQMIGIIVGTALDVQYGVIFGSLFIMPFVVFSGFFVHLNDAPSFLQWLFHVSFIKHGFESVISSIYGFNRGKLDCDDLYCRYAEPKEFLSIMSMNKVEYYPSLLFLIGLYILLDIIAYITLRLRVKKKFKISFI